MRKILIFIITLLIISLIVGCGKEEAAPVGETPGEEVASSTEIANKDGGSGGDAPDIFADGQVELIVAPTGEFEHGRQKFERIYTDNTISSTEESKDKDLYKFSVPAGHHYLVEIVPSSNLDVNIELFDEGGKEITWDKTTRQTDHGGKKSATSSINDAIAGKKESFSSMYGSEKDTRTIYFQVAGRREIGIHQYTIYLKLIGQNDGESGKDALENAAKSFSIDTGKEYENNLLGWYDIIDVYKFSAATNPIVTITPDPDSSLDVSLKILDQGGQDITWELTTRGKTDKKSTTSLINEGAEGMPESITWESTGATQYVQVSRTGGEGYYSIKIS